MINNEYIKNLQGLNTQEKKDLLNFSEYLARINNAKCLEYVSIRQYSIMASPITTLKSTIHSEIGYAEEAFKTETYYILNFNYFINASAKVLSAKKYIEVPVEIESKNFDDVSRLYDELINYILNAEDNERIHALL